MPKYTPTKSEWIDILIALGEAADEIEYDLHDTRDSDFYDADERREREEKADGWRRLIKLITPMTLEDE
jgi:hypothetical protein